MRCLDVSLDLACWKCLFEEMGLKHEDECDHSCKMQKGTLKLRNEVEYFSPHGVLF